VVAHTEAAIRAVILARNILGGIPIGAKCEYKDNMLVHDDDKFQVNVVDNQSC